MTLINIVEQTSEKLVFVFPKRHIFFYLLHVFREGLTRSTVCSVDTFIVLSVIPMLLSTIIVQKRHVCVSMQGGVEVRQNVGRKSKTESTQKRPGEKLHVRGYPPGRGYTRVRTCTGSRFPHRWTFYANMVDQLQPRSSRGVAFTTSNFIPTYGDGGR